GLVHGLGDPSRGLLEAEFGDQGMKLFAVLGVLDGLDTGPDNRDTGVLERPGEVERGLPAELDEHTIRLDPIADVKYMSNGEGLEELQVAGFVVGRHRIVV